jgi:hypothetical protein
MVALFAAFTLAFPSVAQADSCPVSANKPANPGKEFEKKIVIEPESGSELLNFGGNGGTKSFIVVLTASEPLPGGFTGKQLELDSPRRPTRTGPNFDTETLPMPRFSHPQIIEHRRKVRFRVCIDASDADAGVYTDEIIVSGPPGLSSTSVVATANVKAQSGAFRTFVVAVLVMAFLLLLFKAAKESKGEKGEWGKALRETITNPTFVVSTAVALFAALFAMHALYDQDPAWGADLWSNLPALGSAAFAAAGVGSIISAFTSGRDSEQGTATQAAAGNVKAQAEPPPGDQSRSRRSRWLECRVRVGRYLPTDGP